MEYFIGKESAKGNSMNEEIVERLIYYAYQVVWCIDIHHTTKESSLSLECGKHSSEKK